MTRKVRAPDGSIVEVEVSEGMGPNDILKAAQTKWLAGQPKSGGYPVVDPKTPGVVKPSVSGYLAEGARKRSGDILAGVGAAVVPGAGPLALGGRLLAAEAGQDIGDAATGQKVTPGYGAATQLVGEGVAKVAAPLLSPAMYKSFANRTVKSLGDALKRMVPSWEGFDSSHKGVYEMAHGTGQRLLSQNFETSIQGIKKAVPETLVIRVPEVMETAGRIEMIDKPRNARALIDDLPGLRRAGGKPYRQALKALSDQLPQGLSPELDAARREYRFGAGFIEIAEKGKFLHHERYDPIAAQASLDRWGKTLLTRGMDEVRGIMRGPGDKTIEPVKHSQFLQRLEGALVGGAAGMPLGIPHAIGGAAGGVVAGGALPRTTYRNVPLTRSQSAAGRLAAPAVGEGLRETARELNLKDQLPGYGGP